VTTFSLASALFIVDNHNNPTGDSAAAIESIAALGFRATELLVDGEMWTAPLPHETAKLRKALEQFDIDPATIHTPMKGINLGSPDAAIRKDSIQRVASAMRFGADVGARTAIVHPSIKPGPNEPAFSLENLGEAMEYAHDSVSSLVEVSQEAGIRIALENLSGVRMICRPLETMQELRAFISCFPPADVGLCLDVGHSCISGLDPAEQARVGSDRLLAIHIHDVDGSEDCHWVPGHGVIDWSSVAQALSDIRFDGDWTIEVLTKHSESSLATIADECRGLRELWEDKGMCDPSAI
jgi:sugar phosphate isomerase/epimerase